MLRFYGAVSFMIGLALFCQVVMGRLTALSIDLAEAAISF